MKTAKMLAMLVLALGLMVCSAKVSEATPMGTAFTYQGRLIDANSAADGLYDFEFKLFDDANTITGTQLGSPIDINDLDVIDGYFTVELDFGSAVFDGEARWLETTVAHADGSDPCTLMPRQEVTPVPYAMQTRGIFVDNTGNVGIGTTSPSVPLEVAGNAKFNESVILGDAANDNLEINAYVSKDLNLIQWTKPNLNLGSDAINAGNIVVNDAGVARFEVLGSTGDVTISGKVGIGKSSPTYKLDIEGGSAPLQITGGGPAYPKLRFDVQAGGYSVFHMFGGSGSEDFRLATNGNSWLRGPGNVGIGTTSPAAKLDVSGHIHVNGEIRKDVAGGTMNRATPIAYALIQHNGTILSGTPNVVSCVWTGQNYEITISGENYIYNNYVTVVTVCAPGPYVASTFSGNNRLHVHTFSSTGARSQVGFSFVTYKP